MVQEGADVEVEVGAHLILSVVELTNAGIDKTDDDDAIVVVVVDGAVVVVTDPVVVVTDPTPANAVPENDGRRLSVPAIGFSIAAGGAGT